MNKKTRKFGLSMVRGLTNQSGFLLIYTYSVLTILAITAVAFYTRNASLMNASERNYGRIVAFNMAESGLDQAMVQLANDPTYTGTGYVAMDSGSVQGGYTVTVTTPSGFPQMRVVTARGSSPSNDSNDRYYEERNLSAYVEVAPAPLFDAAVFAEESISLQGNTLVDSYNSSEASYSADSANDNGDVHTNSTGSGDIDLQGSVEVHGDAIVGPQGDVNSVIDLQGSSSITGNQTAASKEKTYSVKTTNITSAGNLTLNGNTTLEIAAGTYHYNNFSISGNAELIPSGKTEIYIDGDLTLTGNSITTASNKPSNLIFYVNGGNVLLTGNGSYYGAFYAPNSTVQLQGNGTLYGAVVANTFQQSGNAKIHYDEDLRNNGPEGEDQEVYLNSWNEDSKFLTA